jgi:hypothetical protein
MENRKSKQENQDWAGGDSYSGFTTPNGLAAILIPQPREKNLRSPEAFNCSDSSLCSFESHVIPAKAGIHFAEMDPRFRGGDDV